MQWFFGVCFKGEQEQRLRHCAVYLNKRRNSPAEAVDQRFFKSTILTSLVHQIVSEDLREFCAWQSIQTIVLIEQEHSK